MSRYIYTTLEKDQNTDLLTGQSYKSVNSVMEHNRSVHSLKLLVEGINIGMHPMTIILHLQ